MLITVAHIPNINYEQQLDSLDTKADLYRLLCRVSQDLSSGKHAISTPASVDAALHNNEDDDLAGWDNNYFAFHRRVTLLRSWTPATSSPSSSYAQGQNTRLDCMKRKQHVTQPASALYNQRHGPIDLTACL